MTVIRFILGDQLSDTVSSLSDAEIGTDIIVMAEVDEEADYAQHHRKKLVFIFSAMRHFAQQLRARGHRVDYTRLDDDSNPGSLDSVLRAAISRHDADRVIITEAAEYRLTEAMRHWQEELDAVIELRPDERFLASHDDFATWAEGRKALRMEYFYRQMRRRYDVLMEGTEPVGGVWNYDAENRQPPKQGLQIPPPHSCPPDTITEEVICMVEQRFPNRFGALRPFDFAVCRDDALAVLERFISERLPLFGAFQDAMIQHQPWMFHAHIGLYLNSGLLQPMECICAAEAAFHAGAAPLNAVEGFIRQILGWREYIRGIYWLKMPQYAACNALAAERPLPAFYWTGATEMNCLHQCIEETRSNAYAHHIQRLMVLGNFALLAGIRPDAVNAWFLAVYADAYEWVELPNVSGMALFADGGVLASKPYAASGAYINRMSDYCRGCRYSPTVKTGPDACPFNYLYWDFLDRNRDLLGGNPRMGMIYRSLGKMDEDRLAEIRTDSSRFLASLD